MFFFKIWTVPYGGLTYYSRGCIKDCVDNTQQAGNYTGSLSCCSSDNCNGYQSKVNSCYIGSNTETPVPKQCPTQGNSNCYVINDF